MIPITSPAVQARRIGPVIKPDPSRVLLRPFRPSTDEIARHVAARVMALTEAEAAGLLAAILKEFAYRHVDAPAFFRSRFETVKIHLEPGATPSAERQLLIGAHFTHEYSIEAAALF